MGYHMYKTYYRPRQEISRVLKYFIFTINLIFWTCGVVCLGIGVYLFANDFRPVLEAMDFFLNPSILLMLTGAIIFLVAFLGCAGALREHICMLRAFAFSTFFCYVAMVILAFIVFILFYSDSKTGVSMQTVLMTALKKYHESKNTAEIMDAIQSQLMCCGVGPNGYKDWNENALYNCSPANLSPEKCAVPYSCCKPQKQLSSVTIPDRVTSMSTGGNANIFCGFGAQEKAISEIQNLYVDGCLHPLQKLFEGHAVIIGAVIGAIIIPVCLSVTFTNILAKQIDHQRYLLAKETRREERRRRRQRSKFRDPYEDPSGIVVQKIEIAPRFSGGQKFDSSTSAKISDEQVQHKRSEGNSSNPPPLPPNHPIMGNKAARTSKQAKDERAVVAKVSKNFAPAKRDLKTDISKQGNADKSKELGKKGLKKVKARSMSTDSGCAAVAKQMDKAHNRQKNKHTNPVRPIRASYSGRNREEQVITLEPIKSEQTEHAKNTKDNGVGHGSFDRKASFTPPHDDGTFEGVKKRRYSVAAI